MTTLSLKRIKLSLGADALETFVMVCFFLVSLGTFAIIAPGFLSGRNIASMAVQLPELGLLALAMLVPIISGGLNLSVTFTANIAGLTTAFLLQDILGHSPVWGVLFSVIAGLVVSAFIGFVIGAIVAHVGAHPILVSLGAMILLQGVGEFLTRGAGISGMPMTLQVMGNGNLLGIPVPMIIFLVAAAILMYLMQYTSAGFSIHMVGSNIKAAEYSGINVKRILITLYIISSVLAGLAGMVMLARFNSVRIGHGESYLLITVLACFLAGANPFGGFGRVLPLVLGLMSLQVIASGMNLMGASQYLASAVWGGFLIIVMILRTPFLKKN